jgi:amidase
MVGLAHRSATAMLRALRERELSSRELLEHFLERVERLNPTLNALVTLDVERARKRADEADAALGRGESWGPLHGLPITVKDCFETAGLRTTCGTEEFADHVPAADALAVARLKQAGALIFGKTNTPALTLDWQTTNPVHGTTNNPWNVAHTPGGSSGGSAAAIAAGLSGLELGSDIGGSIRLPAHCCGVFGHKPTWGIIPTRGHVPPAPGVLTEHDINVVGPIARSADDLELALGVLAGPLDDAAKGWKLALPAPRGASLRDYRIAAWLDDAACPVDSAVREGLEASVEALRAAGARVDERARPAFAMADAIALYQRLVAPVVSTSLSAEQFSAISQVADAQRGLAGGPTDDFLRSATLSHRDWLEIDDERRQLRAAWADFFGDFDVLLCPVSPVAAIRHDHRQPLNRRTIQVDGRTRPYTDQIGWLGPVGVSLLPASVAPVGRSPDGLPVGIQIVAPHLEDLSAIDFARHLAREVGGFEPPPGF